MRRINSDEAWRFIPPEEKIEIMTKAHAKGVMSSLIVILLGATCAAALKIPWLLWSVLICSPLVFQFSSGKAWRNLKPATTLRYLAARSAARRYAYSAEAEDLSPRLMFRGTIEQIPDDEKDKLILSMLGERATDVWITLFSDTIVILSEQLGGATLELSHPINQFLEVTLNPDTPSHIGEAILHIKDNDNVRKFKLTTPFPAALVAFVQKYQIFLEENKDDMQRRGRTMGLQLGEDEEVDPLLRLDNLQM